MESSQDHRQGLIKFLRKEYSIYQLTQLLIRLTFSTRGL
jgi:hypothetical protein